jgi:alpha-mannosidase
VHVGVLRWFLTQKISWNDTNVFPHQRDGVAPLFEVDNPAVDIGTVKLAEDRSGDVIVPLYEAHGSRARARIIRSFEAADAYETDLLERPLSTPRALVAAESSATSLELRPFQLVTLRFPR